MEITHKDGIVTVTMRADEATVRAAPFSTSEKTKIVATTSGFMGVSGSGGLKLSLNLTAPLTDEDVATLAARRAVAAPVAGAAKPTSELRKANGATA